VKLLFVDEPEPLRALRRLLTVERLIPPGAHLVRSNPRFLELLPDGVNKGLGLARCAAHLGIDVRDIVCFGDDENDREMLEVCGLGVAMAHAPESVRHAADKVVAREDLAAVVDSL
jgi:HAD superfamily hydrolase (TIGR01484 family)